MWRVAVGACIVALLALTWANYATERLADAERRLDAAERAIKTHERIRDADVSRGDVDADTRWLCEYGGGGAGCP